MLSLYLATRNIGKIKELQELLSHLPLEIHSLQDLPEDPVILEDGETFEENARKKAETVQALTGGIVLADDSGLKVDFLGGEPGVRSARYAGENSSDTANNEKLLQKLEGVPPHKRGARFCCAIAIAAPGRETRVVLGYCRGFIATELRGDQGFGYDPVFLIPAYQKTFGELSPDIKNRISHRGRALAKALMVLEKLLL